MERHGLSDADLSPFFRDADRNSNEAQRRHVAQFRVQLILLIVAAMAGGFTLRWHDGGPDWAGVVAALAFGVAILARLYVEHQRDEREWYESRAAAESAKTLCWRFAVGGKPFPESMSDDEAKRLLASRFTEIGRELKYVEISAPASPGGEITSGMLRLRHAPRSTRIKAYDRDRIRSQQDWYASKSRWNERRARTWLKAVLTAEGLGLLGGVVKATGIVDIGLLGLFSAIAAAIGAWLQMKQHRTLAAAYNVTARELRQVATLVDEAMSPDDWANFVDQAEEAISREHTMWVASRTGRHLEMQ
jgi:protein-S-isoprenylcysteine O-methyltransferase Ste14